MNCGHHFSFARTLRSFSRFLSRGRILVLLFVSNECVCLSARIKCGVPCSHIHRLFQLFAFMCAWFSSFFSVRLHNVYAYDVVRFCFFWYGGFFLLVPRFLVSKIKINILQSMLLVGHHHQHFALAHYLYSMQHTHHIYHHSTESNMFVCFSSLTLFFSSKNITR